MSKAQDVLQWLYAAENDSGGIAAWKSNNGWHVSYPEVSGYLIPTLIQWGATDLAVRNMEWLLSIQNPTGSWDGIDGKPRTFDTSAVVEGLKALKMSRHASVRNAKVWMKAQRMDNGHLRTSPDSSETRIYNLRASQIIGDELPALDLPNPERTHYMAYGLEGMWKAGMKPQVIEQLQVSTNAILSSGLMPCWVGPGYNSGTGTDTCATAQYAMLYGWAGMSKEGERLIRAVESMTTNGGIRHDLEDNREISWAAKFYLDALKANT